ncbi:MAG TPA: hypothetical protein P5307_25425, partial [Pirellulaceae bacterium]|nr:hypothetical protein [Pirellulaceae bacterium]
ERLAAIYETITSRLLDADDTASYLKMVEDLEAIYRNNSALAEKLCEGVTLREGETSAELAAWTMLVSTIFNLDITKTRS